MNALAQMEAEILLKRTAVFLVLVERLEEAPASA